MLAARALFQLFEKITIRVVGTRQNQEKSEKILLQKKNTFFLSFFKISHQVLNFYFVNFDDFGVPKA